MNDEELRYGMRCRFLRDEIISLQPGSQVIRTLVRNDGLKHRNITCAFLVRNDRGNSGNDEAADRFDEDSGASTLSASRHYSGILVVRSFGLCCECSISLRLRLSVLVGETEVRSLPWMEGVEIRDRAPAVRFGGLLQLADFETGSESAQLLEIRLLLDIKAASPSFLLVPRVPTFEWTLLNDEEKEMVEVSCSDGSLCAERSLLVRESSLWKSRLSDSPACSSIDCTEFSLMDMKVFLFYLQTQLFFELARFDTFNTVAKIAVRYSVSGLVKRCSVFVNDCVILAEAGTRRPVESPSNSSATEATVLPPTSPEGPVSSKVRWTPEDLVAIWRTTVSHLGEDGLGRALMRLICQSSYAEIVKLDNFQKLDAATKTQFYHQFLLCREGASASAGSS